LQATGSEIQPNICTVIIGVVAVVFTYISTLVVDKLGRKILLLYSIVIMGICTFFIGGFFYAKDFNYDVSPFGFIPLISLCIFIIVFSVGFGPIPWMMMGEIFPAQIKGNTPGTLFYNVQHESNALCTHNQYNRFLHDQ